MPLPSTKIDVPRASVGGEVSMMLQNEQVTEIDVRQQPNAKFTVTPRGAPAPPAPSAIGIRAARVTRTRRKKASHRNKPKRGNG